MVLGVGLIALALVATAVVAPGLVGLAVPRTWTGSSPSASATSAQDAEVRALLARRGDAVLHHDRRAFAATQTADATAPRYDRVGALPWARYHYSASSSVVSGPDQLLVTATLTLQLLDDTAPASHAETLSLRRVDGALRVTSEDLVGAGVQLWDLGRLTTFHGRHVLVVGIDVAASRLRQYADAADAAVPGVTAVWGRSWPQHAVVVVPATSSQLARGVGTSMDRLVDIAAFAISDPTDDHGPLRIWVNSDALDPLPDLGREVVLRHELTHVASGAPDDAATPTWLEEGFAEYVGYRGSGIPLADEVGDLVSAARKGRALRARPSTAQLRDPATITVAYESAALTCTIVARRWGVAGLVRLYRLTSAGTGTAESNAAKALTRVTGLTPAQFEHVWRGELAGLAA